MKKFKLFIVDSAGKRIFATKTFHSLHRFSKWFTKNIEMFNTKINFVLGLTPVEIYYNNDNSITIWDKENQKFIYGGNYALKIYN